MSESKAGGVSLWGKIGGASLGFALGGPLGALLGALAGHYVVDSDSSPFAADPEIVFTTGLIALAAKMAKADGVVTLDEEAAFRRIVEVPPTEAARVHRLFDLARQTSDGFEAYAAQIAERFSDKPELLEDVLDGLFHIAKADGAVHEAEHRYVARVAGIFGFDEAAFARVEARHVITRDDPWLVLGASRDWDDATLRRHYRRLVAENHPDRQMALGLPAEAVRIAGDRLARINAAWDRVASQRGLR
ncbi:molecular chaperone DjiA [Alsobacter sp. SYSU M60028]|uniref:Molecular chaperone DjiA n=1 Tax=Alsobacter ponti TaxID=2962936 RepID=A0ABT1L6W3_9HYPH|nr:molecular chaperone DjiA [Alsobacter ponti]MCP8937167.1 molecular chaperone DjiA [Alsobacter ponti]